MLSGNIPNERLFRGRLARNTLLILLLLSTGLRRSEAAGITLGDVYSLSYYNSYPVPVYYDNKGMGGAAEAGVPISSGQLTITVDVSVSYEIK